LPVSFDHGWPGEVGFEPAPAGISHLFAQGGIVQQPCDLPRQVGGVARREKQAGHSIADGYGTPPIRLATTGTPLAIASTDVMLKPSCAIVGTRQISAAQ
jgi:hypothetical protein